MTKEEAIAKLKAIDNDDPEMGHLEGDKILCEFLVSLGYKEVVDAWEELDKWYS